MLTAKTDKTNKARRMQNVGHVDYKDFMNQNLLALLQFRSKSYFEGT